MNISRWLTINFTTEDALYKAVSDTVQEEKANVATKEVSRYREALWAGYQSIKETNNIDLDSILGIFRQIKNTSSGLRSPATLTVIQRGQSEFRAGEIIYTPARGAGMLEKLMENLLDYLNDHDKYTADPLLKCASPTINSKLYILSPTGTVEPDVF